jgi:peptidoglycan/LPS O-acetylase OafA/YrhL
MAENAVDTAPRVPEARVRASPKYRPELDGLRAVAVYLVLLFHAGVKSLSGGFVGVDVFFVLSGYLVTKLVLRDLGGLERIRFGRFYSRRFRRLLPAAAVTLLTTAVVYSAIATPVEAASAVGSVRASFVYYANWYFIHHSTAYFGGGNSASPVLQFWSLAVEEQFYLLWPLLLGAVVLATKSGGRYRWNVVRAVVIAGALASAIFALHLAGSSPDRAYYGTDTRAYQLLAGGLLALTPQLFALRSDLRRYAQTAALLAVVALLAIASSAVTMNAIQRGVAVTVVASVLILALGNSSGGVTKRFLSTAPMVYLGQISYGTYLWHWLVILVAARAFHPSPQSTAFIACFVATAFASLSYTMLERPIRTSVLLDQNRGAVIAVGLAISLVAGLVIAPKILESGPKSSAITAIAPSAGSTAVPKLNWNAISNESLRAFPNCLGAPASKCTLVHGTKEKILVIGDSFAWMLLPAFKQISRRDDLTLSASVATLCPWQQGLLVWATPPTASREACARQRADLYKRVLPALRPDIVVLVDTGIDDPRIPAQIATDLHSQRFSLAKNRSQFEAILRDATVSTIQVLQREVPKIVIVEPIPKANFNPLSCLSSARSTSECRYVTDVGTTALESVYRDEARHLKGVWSMNIDPLVCPYLPVCDPIVNNIVVKFDAAHLTTEYSQYLAGPIDKYLHDNRILTR